MVYSSILQKPIRLLSRSDPGAKVLDGRVAALVPSWIWATAAGSPALLGLLEVLGLVKPDQSGPCSRVLSGDQADLTNRALTTSNKKDCSPGPLHREWWSEIGSGPLAHFVKRRAVDAERGGAFLGDQRVRGLGIWFLSTRTVTH